MKHSKKGSRGPRLYFSHFQNRILCAFLLCTLIPIFIIGGISYAVSYNIAKDKILNASISLMHSCIHSLITACSKWKI